MTSFAFCVRFVWTRGSDRIGCQRSRGSWPRSVPIYRSTRLSAFRISRRQRRRLLEIWGHLICPRIAILVVSLISFIDAISEMSFSLTAINFNFDFGMRRKANQNRQTTFLINRILIFSAIDSRPCCTLSIAEYGMKSFWPDLVFGNRKLLTRR